ncbi:Os04g0539300 [Oryza sativa Japonica Group]|uniref:Os04g0539300 protein n=1 Tax=Oryza sativa subsp. japonica TaxID=39947 RepID=A0A0P0WD92_ORYSJ|nr:hypothetical protein EE612_024655 [Oryza sativa]BAS90280.1 Os04g0539300 [Oryza sativa Japonica Group]
MESWWLPTWQPLLVLLPTMLLLYHTVSSWHCGERCLPLPPGPRGLPFVGNILHTSDMTHRGLAQLASRYGGLLHLRLGRLRTVVVSTPEMARLVLHVNDRAFADRPTTAAIDYLTYDRADMVFAPYGPLWRQLRKLCINRLFNRRRAASWAAVHDGVDSLLREVTKNSGAVVNVGELVFGMSMKITLRLRLELAGGVPGMQLGMLAVELALARLLHGFDWSLPGGTGSAGELDMEETYGLTAPRAVRLSAVPVPRLSHL